MPLIGFARRALRFQALLTDMYQVTMSYAYWRAGRQDEHVREPARVLHRLLAEITPEVYDRRTSEPESTWSSHASLESKPGYRCW